MTKFFIRPISISLAALSLVQAPTYAKKTQSDRKEPWSPEKQISQFELADGFVIELVASEENGLINPIDLTFDDSGRLWTQTARMYPLDPIPGIRFGEAMRLMKDHKLAQTDKRFQKILRKYQLEDPGTDQILVIDDPTKTAKGPLHVWADGLTIPQSIMPYKDGCYVAHGSEIFYLQDSDKDNKQDSVKPLFTGFGFLDTHTMAHSIVRAPGGWMNFSHGAVNSGTVTSLISGDKLDVTYSKNLRFSLDGSTMEILNCHRDNNWGYQVLSNGQWYATSANDGGYSVLPSESQSSIAGNGNDNIRPYAPFFPPANDFRVGGTGISGLAFSEDGKNGFPAEWKNVAILANPITQSLNCVRIVRNPDGSVTSELLPNLLQSKDEWFRPVNIEFGPDGCLYIADWYNKIVSHNEVNTDHPDRDRKHGRIWRVRHKSQKSFEIPDVAAAANDKLLDHLIYGKTLWEKRAAWHQIVDRNAAELTPQLKELATDTTTPKEVRILALWSLEGLKIYDSKIITAAIADNDSDIRREAIRSLASYQLKASEVAPLLAPYIEDSNCMVRSQALRTLAEIKDANQDSIALLVIASKPAAPNDNLGGNYERNFERFLARKAMEQYPEEVKKFLLSERADTMPASNLIWASQALPAKERVTIFVNNWKTATHGKIDKNTFISASNMLANPEIHSVVSETFKQRPDEMLNLALENLDQVDAPKVAFFFSKKIETDLNSNDPAQRNKALDLIVALRSPHHTQTLRKLLTTDLANSEIAKVITALGYDHSVDFATYHSILKNPDIDFTNRLSALAACALKNEKQAFAASQKFATNLSDTEKQELVSRLSHTLQGSNIIKQLWQTKILTTNAWDYDAAYFTLHNYPLNWSVKAGKHWNKSPRAQALEKAKKDKRALKIYADLKQQAEADTQQLEEKVKSFTTSIKSLEGNPTTGKALFQSCLVCHKVGNEGQEIAPPLDGGSKRNTEHLITAIVNPDEAVEGAYGLYSVVSIDGSVKQGLLVKSDGNGITLAAPGGQRSFIARENILSDGAVHGRSFMPKGFSSFSPQTMADLVSYIKSLD
ncbi:PVC-type heme-binding CxxCH protein [Rubritalea spongiae]|uniref:PVC-type heme-binding CxxCH protein n=1 Tax=Rubritalea spongiae TaxID=430797 RepID=A0ABW5DYQ2_9BACT